MFERARLHLSNNGLWAGGEVISFDTPLLRFDLHKPEKTGFGPIGPCGCLTRTQGFAIAAGIN
jgi:hypothetical protein